MPSWVSTMNAVVIRTIPSAIGARGPKRWLSAAPSGLESMNSPDSGRVRTPAWMAE